MCNSEYINVLISSALDSGRINAQSAEILREPAVLQRLRVNVGMSQFPATAGVTAICLIVNTNRADSEFDPMQRYAVNRYLEELRGAPKCNEVMVTILRTELNPPSGFLPLSDGPRLGLSCVNMAVSRAVDGLGALILLREEAIRNGQTFRGILVLMATHPKPRGDRLEPLTQLVTDIVSSREGSPFIVIMVGLGTDFRRVGRAMGIPARFIFYASDPTVLWPIMNLVCSISLQVSDSEPSAVKEVTLPSGMRGYC